MKKTHFIQIFGIMAMITITAFSQVTPQLLVLPVYYAGVDEVSAATAESLLLGELAKQNAFRLMPRSQINDLPNTGDCREIICALSIGQQLNADQVLQVQLSRLGEKVVVQFALVDVQKSEVVLSDNITAPELEELDKVMKRIAESVAKGLPIKESATVENIVYEETETPLRRSMRRFTSYSFGYLVPQNGYDNDKRSFTTDVRFGAETANVEIGLQLAARNGIGVNIFASYLVSKTDVSPFIGGAFGFHWVNHDLYDYYDPTLNDWVEDNRRGDGIELTLNSGLRLMRTYDFQILVNLSYLVTFNDFNDKAIAFTIGMLK
jgi:TolB-like protein